MSMAPDDRAWTVSYRKEDGMWFADFMFVDLEHDGFMVSMFVHCDNQYELRFHNGGSAYFMMSSTEMDLFNFCVEEAHEQLIALNKTCEAA